MSFQAFLDPAILFFVFGMAAGLMRSNLEIPAPISRFLSLYLLMALGLKGGFALAKSGLTQEVSATLGLALLLALLVPLLAYWVLRRLVSAFDAAAIAATYGSVSAVTFITATQYLDNRGIPFGGHMAAAMALMESPAILIAILLSNWIRQQAAPQQAPATTGLAHGPATRPSLRHVLHESLTDGAQLLLLGAMVIGIISGAAGQKAMQPFAGDLFKGMLAFFLLDMGLLAARNMGGLKGQSPWLLLYALGAPLIHATLALGLACLIGASTGNTILLMTLAASASYIAVPAVVRHAIPEANPTLYFSLSLGLTFPFNILLGIGLYTQVAQRVLG
ncbi:sodium-dependent bicarbonate transport family permease [Aquabacterium sp.]|uniref:sodium-dependent bicarbonate transport family permease n=1 Tax=Aquabacterium sp. TaxID=1872578 RepID=UPI002E34239D|nr:sodium-dependent bicarbonate transport family permease [Aquabacterium sp.]HEX5312414.1 sodium-dependent bicarbonate transport family permease [Aquabacterium sp.]